MTLRILRKHMKSPQTKKNPQTNPIKAAPEMNPTTNWIKFRPILKMHKYMTFLRPSTPLLENGRKK